MDRVIEKLNAYMERKEYAAAEKHLQYWLEEARCAKDSRSAFSLWNECMGYYRKMGNEEKAVEAAEQALLLLQELHLENTISGGTCYVNAGTVFHAFGSENRALSLFEQALPLYVNNLNGDDARLGGLFNNMALCYVALKRYGEAYRSFERALDVMAQVPGGSLEEAITYLNMADAVEKEHGPEKAEKKIAQYLDKAERLLQEGEGKTTPGYYAFVLEKCAPTFAYYGYFLAADAFQKKAETITAALRREEA